MARRDLVDMYCAQAEYTPPAGHEMVGNTQFPNLNSEEYRRKFSLVPDKVPEFYENLIVNEKGQLLIVANDYR